MDNLVTSFATLLYENESLGIPFVVCVYDYSVSVYLLKYAAAYILWNELHCMYNIHCLK